MAVEGRARVVVDVSSYSCFLLPLPLPLPAKCIRAYWEGHLSHQRQRVEEAWARRGARKTAKKACACVRACMQRVSSTKGWRCICTIKDRNIEKHNLSFFLSRAKEGQMKERSRSRQICFAASK